MSQPEAPVETGNTPARSFLTAIAAAIPVILFATVIVGLQLALADSFGLSASQTSTLVAVSFISTSVLGLVLSLIFRQPIYLVASSTCIVFLSSFGADYSYSAILGATMIAGAIIVVLGALGLTSRLARLIPVPVTYGVVSAILLPFVVDVFTLVTEQQLVVGLMVIAYFTSLALAPKQLPAILPATVLGVAAAAASGQLGTTAVSLSLPSLEITLPTFSVEAILTVTPMLVILIAGVANLSGVILLRQEGYDAPARSIQIATGMSTMTLAILAAIPMNIGYIWIPHLAGRKSGSLERRFMSVCIVSIVLLLLGTSASVLTAIPSILGTDLLYAIVGLALFDVVAGTMTGMFRGQLKLSPVLAFAITMSDLSIFGLGSPFWGLVAGVIVAWTMERRPESGSDV